jgi:hypothetical protein
MNPDARYVGAPFAEDMSIVTESFAVGGAGGAQLAPPLVAEPPVAFVPDELDPPKLLVPPVTTPVPPAAFVSTPPVVPPLAGRVPPEPANPPDPVRPPVADAATSVIPP